MSLNVLEPNVLQTRRAAKSATLFQIGSGWFPERKGGAENVFYNLFRGLQEEGFTVRGVVPGSGAIERETNGMVLGFEVQDTSLPRRAIAIRRAARRSFSEAKPDIVTSHFALYAFPLLDRISDTPFLVHFHGPWAMEASVEGQGTVATRIKKAIEGLVYKRAGRIVVLSQTFGDLLMAEYGVSEAVLRVIPGGVDCDRFDPACSRADARALLGWDTDRLTVFTVRRLVRRMGLRRLIDAIALLRRASCPRSEEIVLHIAGCGPERKALEALAAARGVGNAVRFEGFLPDSKLPLAYRAADVTLVPSVELEGFGLVAVESLAAGTPVLATPVGGLPEILSGLDGLVILEGNDVRSIAEGIAIALRDRSSLPDGDACRRYARRKFDWRVVLPQIASAYREML